MDESKSSTSLVKHSHFIRIGQQTILAIYDDVVDAAANLTLRLFPRPPQLQPCYSYTPPTVRREERHVWIGLE